ncbi:hypothetical protein [Kurthia massiliensis]|uniref:hypothetical protein n=1 Tax=Kurthia massiliensis TaxID=1033739 RepID=UPI0002887387|nr:hypothetical protein [Kurthia massiliensis]
MNEILKKMKDMNDTQQLKFLLSNPAIFVSNPLMFILGISDTLQAKLNYQRYLTLMSNIAIQKRNTALLKATENAMREVDHLNI